MLRRILEPKRDHEPVCYKHEKLNGNSDSPIRPPGGSTPPATLTKIL